MVHAMVLRQIAHLTGKLRGGSAPGPGRLIDRGEVHGTGFAIDREVVESL
jgi:hypothetical protein